MKIRDLIYKKLDEKSADELAKNIVEYLESNSKEEAKASMDDFVDIANLFMFEHGLLQNTGLKDYVLVDFLKSNSFLVKDISLPKSIFSSSILELTVNEDMTISNLEGNLYFDIYKEFVALNSVSRSNKYLARKIVQLMEGELGRKFFRILSYYSAVYCLHLRIDIENEKNEFRKEELNNKLDYMFSIYEDFTRITPTWLEK